MAPRAGVDDPECLEMLRYVNSLSYGCYHRVGSISSCARGVAIASSIIERFWWIFQKGVRRSMWQCSRSLVRLRVAWVRLRDDPQDTWLLERLELADGMWFERP